MDPSLAKSIVQRSREEDLASISYGNESREQTVLKYVIDLSVARSADNPREINFPFRSIFAEAGSDRDAFLYVKPGTREDVQSPFRIGFRDSWARDHAVPRAFLHWDAQPGKTITLLFFTDSEFRSGSQVTTVSGGVTLLEGSALTQSNSNLSATTATQIFASSSTRKTGIFQNKSGASVWVGPSSAVLDTGANRGYEVADGDSFIWRNSAALFAYSVAGGSIHLSEES